jgi:hypothetical protein
LFWAAVSQSFEEMIPLALSKGRINYEKVGGIHDYVAWISNIFCIF